MKTLLPGVCLSVSNFTQKLTI